MSNKTFIISIFILTAGLANSYTAAAQLDIWGHLKELKLEFSEADREREIDIDFQKRIAEKLVDEYTEPEDREYLERAFNELFTASLGLFDTYDHYCRTARYGFPERVQTEFDRPVALEKRAYEKFEKSTILKSEASRTEDIETAKSLYLIAFDLEQVALLHKGRALRIYQDFPVVHAYQWEIDYTILDASPERIVRVIEDDQEAGGDPAPGHIDPVEAYEDPVHIEVTEVLEKGPEEAEVTAEQRPGLKPGDGITWIIQIAAHISEIPENELRRIYSGDQPVQFMVEDGWYKYYLGPYGTYEEAGTVMKSLTPGSAFVAAYMNGQRIGTGEARRRQAAGE